MPYNLEETDAWLASDKTSNLLYGEQLTQADTWGDEITLAQLEFLIASQEAYKNNKAIIEAQSSLIGFDREKILDSIYYWTNSQPELFEIVLSLVINSVVSSLKNTEEDWVTSLVKKHLINNWKTDIQGLHLKTIESNIINIDRETRFWVLIDYGKMLLQGKLTTNDSPEQNYLKNLGLVSIYPDKLTIQNKIYQEVFNLEWVKQQITNFPCYKEQLAEWIFSSFQEEAQLLSTVELEKTLKLLEGQILRDEENIFLIKSQIFHLRKSLNLSKYQEERLAIVLLNFISKAQKEQQEKIINPHLLIKDLIVWTQGELEITNTICRLILASGVYINSNYVEQLAKWLISNYQDFSQLLQGEQLEQALIKTNQNLTEEESRYLVRSLVYSLRG